MRSKGFRNDPIAISHAARERARTAIAAVIAERHSGAVTHLVISHQVGPVGVLAGHFLVPPGGDFSGVQAQVPKAQLVDLAAEVAPGIAAPGTGDEQATVASAIIGHVGGAAVGRTHGEAVLVGVDHPAGVNQRQVHPFIGGVLNAQCIETVAIGVPDPQPVLAVINSAADAEQMREIGFHDHLGRGWVVGGSGTGAGLQPQADGFLGRPAIAAKQVASVPECHVFALAIKLEGCTGVVGKSGHGDQRGDNCHGDEEDA